MRNCGSLKWHDTRNKYSIWIAHTDSMIFNKQRNNNKYNTFVTMEVYDLNISPENQPDFYDVWVDDTVFLASY